MKELILITKSYPFGNKETYVHNEMPFLLEKFDRITIVPIDYYGDGSDLNCTWDTNRVSCFLVNGIQKDRALGYTIRKNFRCALSIIEEIFAGRDGWNHIRHFRFAHTYSKICYDQAKAIHDAIIKRGSEQVIYSYWFHKSALVTAFMKRYYGVEAPIVSRAHSSDLYHRDWNQFIQLEKEPFMPMEWYKVRWCDRIFSITEHGSRHFKSIFPRFSEKFEVARLGVKANDKLNLLSHENIFRMVSCSGITRNKRIIRLPAIVSALRDYPIEWVHIGSSWKENVQSLMNEIDRLGISDKVVLKGQMTQDEIRAYYESEPINLFINISRAEGLPVSIMEAFSFGIPAVATACVGSPEIVDDSCGSVIPVDFTDQELVDSILPLINSSELQMAKRKGALTRFNKEYLADTNYTQFTERLIQLMHSRTEAPREQ
jgi:colanic acid/amylovoran biosynthesis glycosyltransferase